MNKKMLADNITSDSYSRLDLLERAMKHGGNFQTTDIQRWFGLKNPYDAIKRLREKGYCIYLNDTGYRMGNPTREMVKMLMLSNTRLIPKTAFDRRSKV